jgi:uncharacterized protein (DUF1778 family)
MTTKRQRQRRPARRRPKGLNLKQVHFATYLTEEEHELIKTAAANERVSVSSFFTDAALAKARRIVSKESSH